jgi:hypothetical protein
MNNFDVPDYFLDEAEEGGDFEGYDEMEDEDVGEETEEKVKNKVKYYIG